MRPIEFPSRTSTAVHAQDRIIHAFKLSFCTHVSQRLPRLLDENKFLQQKTIRLLGGLQWHYMSVMVTYKNDE